VEGQQRRWLDDNGRSDYPAWIHKHGKESKEDSIKGVHCVTWCVGHLLEQAEPDAYDPQFKQWSLQDAEALGSPICSQ